MIRSAWGVLFAALLPAAMNAQLALMPMPAHVTPGQGTLAIDQKFRVALTGYTEPRLAAAVSRLITRLSVQTGIPLTATPDMSATGATLIIHCDAASAPVQKLGEDESYRLEIDGTAAHLSAPNPLGVLRGMETFLQMVTQGPDSFVVPAVRIEDQPRFAWRGLMLDVSRHWLPVDVVKRTLDGMGAVKLNVFHWHLSDDQGFRVESKTFPKLQEMGSDGDFYTQDQIREVIAYAHERGIRVVPEFDMPGHAASWLPGYPELASGPGPYAIVRTWGVNDPAIDPTRESTYKFLDGFIGEMTRLFPDDYFHIGGDEVNGKQWDANPQIQAFKKSHNIATNVGLQSYFTQRIQKIVSKHGKRMEGWDEILTPDMPKDIVIQSWRGPKSLAEASRMGYDSILSSGYYIDLMQPASMHYLVDPLENESASLTPDQQKHILGAETTMWSEFFVPRFADARIWPRAAAVAERYWSPREIRDVDSMYARLDVVSRWLESVGLTHRTTYAAMLDRLAGDHAVGPIRVLADVVEPVKEYDREQFMKNTQQTPLNKLIDVARPESDTARRFNKMVDNKDRAQIRGLLTVWSINDAQLRPILEQSFLLKDAAPLSEELSSLANAALKAMQFSVSGQTPPEDWLAEQRTLIAQAKKPKAGMLLSVAPGLEKLIVGPAASQ